MPVYNAEKFLGECLDSISRQTFVDWHLIVVDDGSTDRSGVIADAFALDRDNVTVLHLKNSGPFLARRSGVACSSGEYVLFVDADDRLRVDALDRLANCIDEFDPDIISFRCSRKEDYSTKDDAEIMPAGFFTGDGYRLFQRAVCNGHSNNLCGKAFRRSHFDVNSTYEDSHKFLMAEDLYQLLPIVDSASSVARVDDALYYYRSNEESSTGCFKHSYIFDTKCASDRLLFYGQRWNLVEDSVYGSMVLYVNLSKMLCDSVTIMGKDAAGFELYEERAALLSMSTDFHMAVANLRPDYRALIKCVLMGNLVGLRFVTGLSHLVRKGLDAMTSLRAR